MFDSFFKEPLDENSELYCRIYEFSCSLESRKIETVLSWWYIYTFDVPFSSGKCDIPFSDEEVSGEQQICLWDIAPKHGGIVAVLRECLAQGTLWEDLLGVKHAPIKTFKELSGRTFFESNPTALNLLHTSNHTQDDIYRWIYHKEP